MLKIEQLVPSHATINALELPVFQNENFELDVFDAKTIDFLNDLSRAILKDSKINRIPAVVSLAFWLRKSNINLIIKENSYLKTGLNYKSSPIGLVFHVCPSNVDTMFLYSLTTSLLAGNKNILRISKKLDFSFIHILFDIMNAVLTTKQHELFKDYINIVTYGHEVELNQLFSLKSNARIIWGGDNTINTFKQYDTSVRTKDLLFADRLSFSLINTKSYRLLEVKQQIELVKNFFNDSYTFDQKGCSSPQAIILIGNKTENQLFIESFYNNLLAISQQYETDITSLASLKLNDQVNDANIDNVETIINKSNFLVFKKYTTLEAINHTCGGGYFSIFEIDALKYLKPIINNKVQTISYFGLSEDNKVELVNISKGKGVDRIVPIGKSLEFNYIWDGYNLIDELLSKKFIS